MTGLVEVLVGDGGIFAYCRCGWVNGPFISVQKAQAWGDRMHKTCRTGDLLASDPPQDPAGTTLPSPPSARGDSPPSGAS